MRVRRTAAALRYNEARPELDQNHKEIGNLATVDPLEAQIRRSVEQLARRAVALYRVRAVLWAVGLAVVATVGYVGLDYTLHVEERGWRWLLSSIWLVTLLGIAWRWAPEAATFRLTPVQVAQWIERRRPELGDALSRLLAVNEIPDSDPRFGSIEFRRAAGRSDDRALAELPWASFLDKHATMGAAAFCLVSMIAAAFVVLIAGPIASRGVARIAQPWSAMAWPRSEQLQLVDPPSMIARESELEVRVIDAVPPLPEPVELELRIQASDEQAETLQRLPMRIVDQVAVVTLPAMERDFAIRPLGGDQLDSPWHTIRVARQPQLKEYAFAIQAPAYVQQTTPELVGQRIDVLTGSRVTMRGRFDESLKSLRAVAMADSKAANVGKPPAPADSWPAILSSDGHSFELFPVSDESSLIVEDRRWQLELETSEGLRLLDTKQWMIHVTIDRPPSVTLAPIEPRSITRSATLNIVGSASDDLRLTDVDLLWQAAGESPQSLSLWSSQSDSAEPRSADAPVQTDSPTSERAVELNKAWSIAGLSIPVGQPLTVELVARDSAGQLGRSVPQTLQVLDDAAVLANLQRQQAEAFAPLRQLLDAQRRNQQSLNRTVNIASELSAPDPEQVEALGSAQQLGQNIGASLSRNPDSLARQLQGLSDQLQRNQLNDTPLAGEIARLRSQIDSLVSDQLEPALKELDAAHEAMRGASNASTHSAAVSQLAKAVQRHQQATDQFSQLVDTVAVAESLADIQRQVQELANDQAAVTQQTERLQVDNLLKGTSPQIDAQRAGIQSDQQNLARRVEEMASRLAKELKPDEAGQGDPASEKLIQKAHQKLLQRGISDQMRQAAESVKENRLNDALVTQQQASQLLEEVATELGGNSSKGLESSSQSMQDMATQLKSLATNQQQVAEALQQAANASAGTAARRQLATQQQALRDELQKVSSEASVPAQEQLQELLQEATESIDQAVDQTEQNHLQEASQSAGQAADKLKTAAQSAQQRAEQLKSQVAEQQIFDLRALLSAAVKRQQPVVASLEWRQNSGNGSKPPEGSGMDVGAMIATEQQLQQQLLQERQRLRSLDAFEWLLSQCDDELLRTIASLERQRMGAEALASAKAALDMLQAAEVAVNEAANHDSQPQETAAAENQQNGESNKSQLPTLASLRLLRQMQNLINNQTTQLLESQGNGEPSSDALTRMADRQQALAEQVARIREQLQQQSR